MLRQLREQSDLPVEEHRHFFTRDAATGSGLAEDHAHVRQVGSGDGCGVRHEAEDTLKVLARLDAGGDERGGLRRRVAEAEGGAGHRRHRIVHDRGNILGGVAQGDQLVLGVVLRNEAVPALLEDRHRADHRPGGDGQFAECSFHQARADDTLVEGVIRGCPHVIDSSRRAFGGGGDLAFDGGCRGCGCGSSVVESGAVDRVEGSVGALSPGRYVSADAGPGGLCGGPNVIEGSRVDRVEGRGCAAGPIDDVRSDGGPGSRGGVLDLRQADAVDFVHGGVGLRRPAGHLVGDCGASLRGGLLHLGQSGPVDAVDGFFRTLGAVLQPFGEAVTGFLAFGFGGLGHAGENLVDLRQRLFHRSDELVGDLTGLRLEYDFRLPHGAHEGQCPGRG